MAKSNMKKAKAKRTKIPVSAGKWLSNAGKSFGLSGIEIIKDIMPATSDYIESATDSAMDFRNLLLKFRSQQKRMKDAVSSNFAVDTLKEAKKNTVESLKTGELYKPAFSSDNDDFDFDFDDDFDDSIDAFDVDVKSDDGVMSVTSRSGTAEDKTINQTNVSIDIGEDSNFANIVNYQSKIFQQSIGKSIETNSAFHTNIMAQLNTQLGNIYTGIKNVDSNISVIAESMKVLSNSNSVALKYYEDSIGIFTEIRDSLKQWKEFSINPKESTMNGDYNDPEKYNNVLDDLVSYNSGKVNLGEYAKLVKKQFGVVTDNNLILSSLKNVLNDKGTLRAIISRPLNLLMEGTIKGFIGPALKRTASEFDSMLRSSAIAALSRVKNLGNSSNPILQMIGDTFGIGNKLVTKINKANYNKGRVDWNGQSHKTLNEVIPYYLRKMTAALTGTKEMGYDYEQGRFREVGEIIKEYENSDKRALRGELQNYIGDFKNMLEENKIAFSTIQQQDRLYTNFESLIDKLVNTNGIPLKLSKDNNSFARSIADIMGKDINDVEVQLISSFFDSRKRHELTDMLGRGVLDARNNFTKQKLREENGEIARNNMYVDNGTTFDTQMQKDYSGNITNRVDYGKSILGGNKDKYGKTSVQYLSDIYKLLANGIIVYPMSLGGGDVRPLLGDSDVSKRIDNINKVIKDIKNQSDNYDKERRKEREKVLSEDERHTARLQERGYKILNTNNPEEGRRFSSGSLTVSEKARIQAEEREEDTKNPTWFMKLSNLSSDKPLTKIMNALTRTIQKPTEALSNFFNKADEFMFRLIFGGDTKIHKASLINIAMNNFQKYFSKFSTFLNDHILQPLYDNMFGDNGFITKLKSSQFSKDIISKLSGFRVKLYGSKDESGRYTGGLLSDIANQLKDVGHSVKTALIGSKDADGNFVDSHGNIITQDNSILGNIKRMTGSIVDSTLNMFGYNRRDGNSNDSEGNRIVNMVDSIWIGFKDRVKKWVDDVLGPDDEDNIRRQFFEAFKFDMKGKGGKIGAGATIGLLSSFFMPYGAIGGALIGAGTSIVQESETLKDFLFGHQFVDENGNLVRQDNGLIPEQLQNVFKNNKKGISVGSFLGLASSVGFLPAWFMPGGPIGGALIGGALSAAYHTESFQTFLYGPADENGDRITGNGFLNKVKKFWSDQAGSDTTGANFIHAGIGAGVGFLGSFLLPGGPLINSILGAATGITLGSDRFKNWLFGDINEETNKREGGVLGKAYDAILSPIRKAFLRTQTKLQGWVERRVLSPIITSMKPVFAEIKNIGNRIKGFFKNITDSFHHVVIKPVGDAFKQLTDPIRKMARKLVGGLFKAIGGLITSPIRILQMVGYGLNRKHMRQGKRSFIEDTIIDGLGLNRKRNEERRESGEKLKFTDRLKKIGSFFVPGRLGEAKFNENGSYYSNGVSSKKENKQNLKESEAWEKYRLDWLRYGKKWSTEGKTMLSRKEFDEQNNFRTWMSNQRSFNRNDLLNITPTLDLQSRISDIRRRQQENNHNDLQNNNQIRNNGQNHQNNNSSDTTNANDTLKRQIRERLNANNLSSASKKRNKDYRNYKAYSDFYDAHKKEFEQYGISKLSKNDFYDRIRNQEKIEGWTQKLGHLFGSNYRGKGASEGFIRRHKKEKSSSDLNDIHNPLGNNLRLSHSTGMNRNKFYDNILWKNKAIRVFVEGGYLNGFRSSKRNNSKEMDIETILNKYFSKKQKKSKNKRENQTSQPLGAMAFGGNVPQTGAYVLSKGEFVIPNSDPKAAEKEHAWYNKLYGRKSNNISGFLAGGGTIEDAEPSGKNKLSKLSALFKKNSEIQRKAKEKRETKALQIKGSYENKLQIWDKLKEKEERQKFYNTLYGKIDNLIDTTKEHLLNWKSVFSKKGLLTASLLLAAPIIVKAANWLISFINGEKNPFSTLFNNIQRSLDSVGGLQGVKNNVSELVTDIKELFHRDSDNDGKNDTIASRLHNFILPENENGENVYDHLSGTKLRSGLRVGSHGAIKLTKKLFGLADSGDALKALNISSALNYSNSSKLVKNLVDEGLTNGEIIDTLQSLGYKNSDIIGLSGGKKTTNLIKTGASKITSLIGKAKDSKLAKVFTFPYQGMKNAFKGTFGMNTKSDAISAMLKSGFSSNKKEALADLTKLLAEGNSYADIIDAVDGKIHTNIFEKAKNFGSATKAHLQGMNNFVHGIGDRMHGMFGDIPILDNMKSYAGAMKDKAKNVVNTQLSSIGSKINGGLENAKNFVKTNVNKVTTNIASKKEVLSNKFTNSKAGKVAGKMTEWVQKAISMLSDKFGKLISKFGASGANLKKFLSSITKTLGKATTKLNEKFPKLAKHLGISAGTAGIADIVFLVFGVVDGAASASNLFQIDDEYVDGKMRAISAVYKGFANTSIGIVIDIINEVIYELMGTNFVRELAVIVYDAISTQEESDALENAANAFRSEYDDMVKSEYEKYKKEQSEEYKNTYNKAYESYSAKIGTKKAVQDEQGNIYYEDYTEEDAKKEADEAVFMQYKASDNVKSFSDYNAEKHKTLGNKIVTGVKNVVGNVKNVTSNLSTKSVTDVFKKDYWSVSATKEDGTLKTQGEIFKEQTRNLLMSPVHLVEGLLGDTINIIKTTWNGLKAVVSGFKDNTISNFSSITGITSLAKPEFWTPPKVAGGDDQVSQSLSDIGFYVNKYLLVGPSIIYGTFKTVSNGFKKIWNGISSLFGMISEDTDSAFDSITGIGDIFKGEYWTPPSDNDDMTSPLRRVIFYGSRVLTLLPAAFIGLTRSVGTIFEPIITPIKRIFSSFKGGNMDIDGDTSISTGNEDIDNVGQFTITGAKLLSLPAKAIKKVIEVVSPIVGPLFHTVGNVLGAIGTDLVTALEIVDKPLDIFSSSYWASPQDEGDLGFFRKVLFYGSRILTMPIMAPIGVLKQTFKSFGPVFDGITFVAKSIMEDVASAVSVIDNPLSVFTSDYWSISSANNIGDNDGLGALRTIMFYTQRALCFVPSMVFGGVKKIGQGLGSLFGAFKTVIPLVAEDMSGSMDMSGITGITTAIPKGFYDYHGNEDEDGPAGALGTLRKVMFYMGKGVVTLPRLLLGLFRSGKSLVSSIVDSVKGIGDAISDAKSYDSKTSLGSFFKKPSNINGGLSSALWWTVRVFTFIPFVISKLIDLLPLPDWVKKLMGVSPSTDITKDNVENGSQNTISTTVGNIYTSGSGIATATRMTNTNQAASSNHNSVNAVLNSGTNILSRNIPNQGGYGDDKKLQVNGFKYYSQNDPNYSNKPYNLSNGVSDTIGNRGCGTTSMAMIASQLTQKEYDPYHMSKLSTMHGFSTERGTEPNYFRYAANKLGISSSQESPTEDNIKKYLTNGNPIILQGVNSGDKNSPYTTRGHYVVGVGLNSDGTVAVNDPRGIQYSGNYKLSDLTKGSGNMWAFGTKFTNKDTVASEYGGFGNGSDILNNFPYFSQGDSRWGANLYTIRNDPKQTISSSGCGPTAMSMVLHSYGIDMTPDKVADYSLKNGYRTQNSGTAFGLFKSLGEEYGLTTEHTSANATNLSRFLDNNIPVIASMSKGHFTSGGHYIVLVGKDSSGNIIVNDPAGGKGKTRSMQTWNPNIITSEATNFWGISSQGKGSINNVTNPVNSTSIGNTGTLVSSPTIQDNASSTTSNVSSANNVTSFASILSQLSSSLSQSIMQNMYGNVPSSSSEVTETTDVNAMKSQNQIKDNVGTKASSSMISTGNIPLDTWKYFKSAGYNDAGTAGIMGNLKAESGINPAAIQSSQHAAGIAQWESYKNKNARWGLLNNFAKSRNKDWTDLSTQLDFLQMELTGDDKQIGGEGYTAYLLKKKGGIDALKNATSPEAAAKLFEETFERAGIKNYKKRFEYANEIYNTYKNTGGYGGGDGDGDKIDRKVVVRPSVANLNKNNNVGGYGTSVVESQLENIIKYMGNSNKQNVDIDNSEIVNLLSEVLEELKGTNQGINKFNDKELVVKSDSPKIYAGGNQTNFNVNHAPKSKKEPYFDEKSYLLAKQISSSMITV